MYIYTMQIIYHLFNLYILQIFLLFYILYRLINFFKTFKSLNFFNLNEFLDFFKNFISVDLNFLFINFLSIFKNYKNIFIFLLIFLINYILFFYNFILTFLFFVYYVFLTYYFFYFNKNKIINVNVFKLNPNKLYKSIFYGFFVNFSKKRGYIINYYFTYLLEQKILINFLNFTLIAILFIHIIFRIQFLLIFGVSYFVFYNSVYISIKIINLNEYNYENLNSLIKTILINWYNFYIFDIENQTTNLKIILKDFNITHNPCKVSLLSYIRNKTFNIYNYSKYLNIVSFKNINQNNDKNHFGILQPINDNEVMCVAITSNLFFNDIYFKNNSNMLKNVAAIKNYINQNKFNIATDVYISNKKDILISEINLDKFDLQQIQILSVLSILQCLEKPIYKFESFNNFKIVDSGKVWMDKINESKLLDNNILFNAIKEYRGSDELSYFADKVSRDLQELVESHNKENLSSTQFKIYIELTSKLFEILKNNKC